MHACKAARPFTPRPEACIDLSSKMQPLVSGTPFQEFSVPVQCVHACEEMGGGQRMQGAHAKTIMATSVPSSAR